MEKAKSQLSNSKKSRRSRDKPKSLEVKNNKLDESLKELRSEFSRLRKEVHLTTELNRILNSKKADIVLKLHELQKQTKSQSKKSIGILLNLICNYKDQVTDDIKKVLLDLSILTKPEKKILDSPEQIKKKIPELMGRIAENKTVKKTFFDRIAQILNVQHSSRYNSNNQEKSNIDPESESKGNSEEKIVQSDNSKNDKVNLKDEQYINRPKSLNDNKNSESDGNRRKEQ